MTAAASRLRSLLDVGDNLEMRTERDGPATESGWSRAASLTAHRSWGEATLPYNSASFVINVRKIEGGPTINLICAVAPNALALQNGEYQEIGRASVTSAPQNFVFAVDLRSIPMPAMQPGESEFICFAVAHQITGGSDPKLWYDAFLSVR